MAAPVGLVTMAMRCGSIGIGFFARGIEEPFLRELFLELLERQLQRAEAGGLDGDGIELELTFLLVKRQPAANDELQSVLDSETKEARIHGKKDHAHLRPGVFDRKIKMPGCRSDDVRRFAFDADVVVTKEIQVDLPDQLADLPDAFCHPRMVVKSNLGKLVALP